MTSQSVRTGCCRSSKACGTASSNPRYGQSVNRQLIEFMAPISGTVIDIGSGCGAWAPELRAAGASRLVAMEPDSAAAEVAAAHYDLVVNDPVETVDATLLRDADLFVLADCLEHLVDPWAVLSRLRAAAKPEARLAISVPNLRHARILARLVVRGRFEYCDEGGVMDRTHLRWFTRRSLESTLRATGWEPTRWAGVRGRTGKVLPGFVGRLVDDFSCHQLHMMATPAQPPAGA